MKNSHIYNDTSLNTLEDFRDRIRSGNCTPNTRRAAACYMRSKGCGVKPGTTLKTTYKKDKKIIEVIKTSEK